MIPLHIYKPTDLGLRSSGCQLPIVTSEQMHFCRRLALEYTGRKVVKQEVLKDFMIKNTLDNGQAYKISIFLIDKLIAKGI